MIKGGGRQKYWYKLLDEKTVVMGISISGHLFNSTFVVSFIP